MAIGRKFVLIPETAELSGGPVVDFAHKCKPSMILSEHYRQVLLGVALEFTAEVLVNQVLLGAHRKTRPNAMKRLFELTVGMHSVRK
ncbi:hypothetical protein [Leisingera sp. ANG59]|uniref:hypothetical protein n=1 Tax=Leisingera sp. ANG59 TaxID=2675221 RepID=UPI001574A30F|nr:hypothetical protein [Leisingera sp. ANG59]